MNTQQSAVALRFIIVAALSGVDGDSLDQLSSHELPDGMLVSVLSTKAIYRLDKLSTLTPVSGVVAPGAGPGRFIFFAGQLASPFAMQVTGTAALSGATAETDDTWIATPVGTNFYAASAPNGIWSVGLSSGIATYEGPSGMQYRVTVGATLASAVAAQSVEIASDRNGVLIGSTVFVGYAGVANVSPTTAGLGSYVQSTALITPAPGDTVQAIMRDTSASNNITVSHLNMVITPV
jgi:hypothetical protein